MIKDPVVFVTDDFLLKDNFELLTEKLLQRGIRVITGPPTIPGGKKEYAQEEILQFFQDVDVVMGCPRTIANRRFLENCRHILGIVYPGIGVETLDVQTATENGIAVGFGPIPENFISVAEFAVALILMSVHRMLSGVYATYGKAQWHRDRSNPAGAIYKKKIGFLGFGRIGRAVAERLQHFDVEMLAYSPSLTKANVPDYIQVCTKEEVIRKSDVLGLYVVINDDTRNMINRDTLAMMKPTAYLINIARGEAVNEEDLYEALKNGVIAGAALDTYQHEPLPPDSGLRMLDNVILTPHIAASTRDQFYASLQAEFDNIVDILEGRLPRYCKNPEVERAFFDRYELRNSI
ncbi:MAG: hypothetical protein IJ801_02715 [Lachnospiraceae bacterium]|nr:hypothetical protein [Lachnospiraceae bacterium]